MNADIVRVKDGQTTKFYSPPNFLAIIIVVDAAFSEQCMYIRRCCLSVITGSCTNINVIKIIILKMVKQYSIFLEWNDLKM